MSPTPSRRIAHVPLPVELDPKNPPASNPKSTKQQLSEAIGGAQEVLFSATTVFPFTLFPDTVTIDRAKLTVTHRTFFMSAEVMSIRIEDVLNVTANVDPFFGSVRISTRFFSREKPYTVKFLKRSDALKIKRIMQGYIIATQKEIDCSKLTTQQLVEMLDSLGQGAPNEEI